MNKKTNMIPIFLIFIAVFVIAYKNSDVKGFRRFLISFKLAMLIAFSQLSPADAKDNGFLPGADGFTPPISRSARNNYGYFGSKTTSSSSGAPKKDPNGNGIPQDPAVTKNSQFTSTFHQHVFQKQKKKNEQCSLEDQKKSRQTEKELKNKHGKRIEALIAQRSDHRYFLDDAQARDKYIHAPDFDVKVPESFNLEHAKSLSYHDRLKYLRDRTVLPEKSVREFQEAMRDHVLDPNTKEISGTFGANRQAHDGTPKTKGTHLYNPKTKNDLFFGPGNRLKSGWKTNQGQSKNIEIDHNLT